MTLALFFSCACYYTCPSLSLYFNTKIKGVKLKKRHGANFFYSFTNSNNF